LDPVDYCGGAGWDFSVAASGGSRIRDLAGALVPGRVLRIGGLYCALRSGAPFRFGTRAGICRAESFGCDLVGGDSFAAFFFGMEREDSDAGGDLSGANGFTRYAAGFVSVSGRFATRCFYRGSF